MRFQRAVMRDQPHCKSFLGGIRMRAVMGGDHRERLEGIVAGRTQHMGPSVEGCRQCAEVVPEVAQHTKVIPGPTRG